MDCDGCRTEKETLRELHPSYVKTTRATTEGWEEFCALIKSEDELAGRRNVKEMTQKWVEASVPDFPDYDQARLIRAQWVCGALMKDVRVRFQQEWLKMNARQESMFILHWLERVYVSVGRHPEDPEALVHEFLLLFNDRQPFRMVWAQMSVARRKFLERIWGGVARSVWSQDEAEEAS